MSCANILAPYRKRWYAWSITPDSSGVTGFFGRPIASPIMGITPVSRYCFHSWSTRRLVIRWIFAIIPEDSFFSFWRIIHRIFFLLNFIVELVFGSTSDIGNTFGTVHCTQIFLLILKPSNKKIVLAFVGSLTEVLKKWRCPLSYSELQTKRKWAMDLREISYENYLTGYKNGLQQITIWFINGVMNEDEIQQVECRSQYNHQLSRYLPEQ